MWKVTLFPISYCRQGLVLLNIYLDSLIDPTFIWDRIKSNTLSGVLFLTEWLTNLHHRFIKIEFHQQIQLIPKKIIWNNLIERYDYWIFLLVTSFNFDNL